MFWFSGSTKHSKMTLHLVVLENVAFIEPVVCVSFVTDYMYFVEHFNSRQVFTNSILVSPILQNSNSDVELKHRQQTLAKTKQSQ